MSPTVSVLIPCYNAARHIGNVVAALQNQTRLPDEIIVVDDHSTDESVQILRDLPVRLICHAENQGPAAARNTALHAATADIVIFIDSDAYPDPHMLQNLLESYAQPSSKPLAGVGGRGIESNIQNLFDRWRSLHARQDFGPRPRDGVQYLFGLCMSYYREAILAVGGFDTSYPINAGEDFDLGFRLMRRGYLLRYTPEAVVYHQHSDDEARLKRVQSNWYYWSFLAKRRTGYNPWTLVAGTLRRLITDTMTDLFLRRDLALAKLDLEISWIKLRALFKAALTKPAK